MTNFSKVGLGEKIRQLRIVKGLSQENIAHFIGRNRFFYQRIENEQVECDTDTLAAIKEYMQIENAPLLEHELQLYYDRIWVWNDLLTTKRLDEARAMQKELSIILDLPFETELSLLFAMTETRLLLADYNDSAAEEKLKAAEALLEEASDEALLLYHFNKGLMYGTHGDFKNALKHSLRAHELTNDKVKLEAHILRAIGVCYVNLGKVTQAILFLERAKAKNTLGLANPFAQTIDYALASIYLAAGDYGKAKKLIDMSLTSAKNIGDEYYMGLAISNSALLYKKLGDYERALKLYDQALKYNKDKTIHYATALNNKMNCLRKMKEFAQCEELLKEAVPLAEGNEELTISFETQRHYLSKDDNDSIDYLENTALPYYRNAGGLMKFAALDLCDELEEHYKKRKAKTKANAIAAVARDILKELFMLDDGIE